MITIEIDVQPRPPRPTWLARWLHGAKCQAPAKGAQDLPLLQREMSAADNQRHDNNDMQVQQPQSRSGSNSSFLAAGRPLPTRPDSSSAVLRGILAPIGCRGNRSSQAFRSASSQYKNPSAWLPSAQQAHPKTTTGTPSGQQTRSCTPPHRQVHK